MISTSATSQKIADFLKSGYWKSLGQSAHKFDLAANHEITVNLTGLDASAQKVARAALDAWEAVANVKFVETSGSARIEFDDAGDGSNTYVKLRGSELASADVVIGTSWMTKYGSKVGGYGFQTYVHEIGHALGLGHAGAYNGGASFETASFSADSWQLSVMSYLDQDENPTVKASKAYVLTPMMADVLAIQAMYGKASGGVTAGNTTYGVGSHLGTYLDAAFAGSEGSLKANALTIFDESGKDTFDFSNDTAAQKLNLAGGTFSTVYGHLDHLAIAKGTIIENLVAGSGDDLVSGNEVKNSIWGNGGDDRICGFGGNDRLDGGLDNDRIDGGAGNDTILGGDGNDAFVFSKGYGSDTILDFRDNVDTIMIDNALWGNATKTVAQVVAMAHLDGGDAVFAFADGSTLRVHGVTDLNVLLDDLTIV